MKNFGPFFALFVGYLIITGCPNPAPKVPVLDLGKPFTLAQGESMQTAENALNIHFDSVSSDSRCPEGVQCIWAGRADCIFTLTSGGTTESVTLSSGDFSQGGAGQITFNGYTVTLNNIEPLRKPNAEILQKDYRATLTVTQ